MNLIDIFHIENAKSKGYSDYDEGKIPFITNGFTNNGFVGFVEPYKNDKVVISDSICISAFCEATVQKAPYLPRGNGGSGLMILLPKEKMLFDEMCFYASYINKIYNPRFFYGRMVTRERLARLDLKRYTEFKKHISLQKISSLLPSKVKYLKIPNIPKFKQIPLYEIVSNITTGDYHVSSDLDQGNIPFISCSTLNNGITSYVNIEKTYENCITIASDGMIPSTAFYQPFKFNAQDNVLICKLKEKYKPHTIFFILTQINKLNWRFSYGRKCYENKLDKIILNLPFTDQGKIDEEFIEKLAKNCYGWELVKKYFK